jgi:hypothetical protein
MTTDSSKINRLIFAVVLGCLLGAGSAAAQTAPPKMKMTTEIPSSITTPDRVDTRLGTLEFFDGAPSAATVQKMYDNLDFQRGGEVFLNAMPGASVFALRQGFRDAGCGDGGICIMEKLVDSKSLFLTPNKER